MGKVKEVMGRECLTFHHKRLWQGTERGHSCPLRIIFPCFADKNVRVRKKGDESGFPGFPYCRIGLGLRRLRQLVTVNPLMKPTVATYRQLEAQRIIETIQTLQNRIQERFPTASLNRIVRDLLAVAQETVTRIQWIQRPHRPLRCAAIILSLGIIALLACMVMSIRQFDFHDYTNFTDDLTAGFSRKIW